MHRAITSAIKELIGIVSPGPFHRFVKGEESRAVRFVRSLEPVDCPVGNRNPAFPFKELPELNVASAGQCLGRYFVALAN